MTEAELLAHAPNLFHVTFAGGWDALRSEGLLSTSAILDACRVPEHERVALERRRRETAATLTLPSGRRVILRDQRPLVESKVALEGGWTFERLCLELNRRVFLFADADRLGRLLTAYDNDDHEVLVIDTERLLARPGVRVELCRVNSGTAQWPGQRRGPDTFLPIASFPWPAARSRRSLAEVTVIDRLDDLEEVVVSVTRFRGPSPGATVFRSQWDETVSGADAG